MFQKKNVRNNGFTLIELLVTLAVFAILASMAAPSMNTFFDKRRLIAASEDLYSNIQQARAESISRSQLIYVKFSGAAPGASWQYGISQNADCDLVKINPAEASANACVLVIDDGDGTLDDGTATIDSADLVLHRFTNADYTGVKINSAAPTEISFDPRRGTVNSAASIELESADGYKLKLKVGILGQVKICSPAGSGNVAGYSSDDC